MEIKVIIIFKDISNSCKWRRILKRFLIRIILKRKMLCSLVKNNKIQN